MSNAEWAEVVGLVIPVMYFAMLAVEARWPARRFPPRRGWRWVGIAFLLLIFAVGATVPLLLPLPWLAAHRLMDGTVLGVAGGTVVGWVVMSAFTYAYHRLSHAWSPLWRLSHQLHHSPQQVDIPGSLVFHPFEMVMQVVIQILVTTLVLGLDPLAAALTGVVAAFYGLFQHWNVRTPAWLGYLIQRPEAHCVHHRRGLHFYNFADFPPWDMLAGTWRNPAQFHGECGFESPADARMGAMLAFADANESLYGPASRGVKPAT